MSPPSPPSPGAPPTLLPRPTPLSPCPAAPQYDEYDNALNVMITHSPIAWEHVKFKDVAVKVKSQEALYKGISFYLEEHPDLLNDLLKASALGVGGRAGAAGAAGCALGAACLWGRAAGAPAARRGGWVGGGGAGPGSSFVQGCQEGWRAAPAGLTAAPTPAPCTDAMCGC